MAQTSAHSAGMNRILVTLTHAISQLTRKWLPPPTWSGQWPASLCALATLWEHDDPRLLTAGDWEVLFAALVPAIKDEASPIGRVMQRRRQDAPQLAVHLTAHFADLVGAGGHQICLGDPDYPPLLATIPDPPLCLSLLGDPQLLSRPAVAVVGSRKASGLAMAASHQLGRQLSELGLVVVSGGAFGCDIGAHAGVLSAQTRPSPAVVVFAGGLAALYPRQHLGLFRRLQAAGGALVSERLWGADCRPVDFLARNRIISGLASSTVVMQASTKSGAGITAKMAIEQGRNLYVMAHPPGDVRATGSAALLSDGAVGFVTCADLIDLLSNP